MDRIAQILKAQGGIRPIGGIAPYGQMQTVSNPSFAPLQNVAQPAEAFQWGAGGQRLSMDDISRQREQAAEQLANGMDYSPIASPWQGAARFSQAIIGALGEKKADKDAAAYQAQQQGDLAAAGISPDIALLLSNPDTASIGVAKYKATLPAKGGSLPDIVQLQQIADDPSQTLNVRKAALDRVKALNDPLANITVAGTNYAGPQSLVLQALMGRGDQPSPVSGGASPPPQAAIDYLRSNPNMASDFDAKYGAGSSSQYLGGAR